MTTSADRAAIARQTAKFQFHLRLEGLDINFYGDSYCLEELARFYDPYYLFDREFVQNPAIGVYVDVCPQAASRREAIRDMQVYLSPSTLQESEPGFYCCSRPLTSIELIVAPSQGAIYLFGEIREEVMLQLRTFVRDQILQQIQKQAGSVLVHAAAVEKNDIGIIFVGERNAGKTASLMAFASRGDYNLVSADRVALSAAGKEINGLGFPLRCNVHRIALDADPILSQIKSRWRLEDDDSENKILVPLGEIAGTAGIKITPQFKLGAVLLPRIDPLVTSLSFQRVCNKSELFDILRSHQPDTGGSSRSVHWLHYFPRRAEIEDSYLNQIVDIIADKVPVYRAAASHIAYITAIQERIVDTVLGL